MVVGGMNEGWGEGMCEGATLGNNFDEIKMREKNLANRKKVMNFDNQEEVYMQKSIYSFIYKYMHFNSSSLFHLYMEWTFSPEDSWQQ